jgi:polysaccharide biosynthesis protein PslH
MPVGCFVWKTGARQGADVALYARAFGDTEARAVYTCLGILRLLLLLNLETAANADLTYQVQFEQNMHILWLRADYLSPLTTGSRNRSYNLLKRLCPEAEVSYVGFSSPSAGESDSAPRECMKSVFTVPKDVEKTVGLDVYLRVAANLLTGFPYFTKRNVSRAVQEHLAGMIASGSVDLLVCDGLDASLNVDFTSRLPKILYHHALETPLWSQRHETATGALQKAYFNYETKRMAAFESNVCNRFDLVVTTSERDKEILQSEYRVTKPVAVVPIGVDCEYFRPDPSIKVIPRRLVFSGKMDLLSNIDQLLWFCSEIYPLVKRQFPDVTFEIVGRNPAAEVVALGQADRSIIVTGWVDDLRPHVGAGDIYVVPLRIPGGTRVKLYEAMALRRPVVSTSYGAEGLEVVPGRDLVIADTPREFASAIIGLLESPQRKDALAEQGWRLVNGHCDWSIRAAQLMELFRGRLTATESSQRL